MICPTCGSDDYLHGLPDCDTTPEQGWDHVNDRPTLVMTYRLFEEDHGLRCPRCQRIVTRGQPYEAIMTGVTDDGEPVSELVCVYCAAPADRDHSKQPRETNQ